MIEYNDLKKWYSQYREKIIYAVCFVLVFLVGFGVGKAGGEYDKNIKNSKQVHSNINARENTDTKQGIPDPVPTPPPPVNAAPTALPVNATNCPVKGNISSKSRIYHVKGGSFYERTQPEQCFNTEAEAVAAGFRKSSR